MLPTCGSYAERVTRSRMSSVPRVCAACGAPSAWDARFCQQCGRPLGEVAKAPRYYGALSPGPAFVLGCLLLGAALVALVAGLALELGNVGADLAADVVDGDDLVFDDGGDAVHEPHLEAVVGGGVLRQATGRTQACRQEKAPRREGDRRTSKHGTPGH